jgi:hypothetical protein
MRGRIGNQHNDLCRVILPVNLESSGQSIALSFRPVSTASNYQASQIRRDDSEIGRERELLSDEALVLRRMVAEGDEAESEILRCEFAPGYEGVANLADLVACGVDVWLLAPCSVLEEHDVTELNVRSVLCSFHATKCSLQWCRRLDNWDQLKNEALFGPILVKEVEDSLHRTDLRESHRTYIEVVVGRPSFVLEFEREKSSSDFALSLDDAVWNTEVQCKMPALQ